MDGMTSERMHCGHCNDQLGHLKEMFIEGNISSHHKCFGNATQLAIEGTNIFCINNDEHVASSLPITTNKTFGSSAQLDNQSLDEPEEGTHEGTQWTENMTKLLISAYKSNKSKFQSPMYNKKQVWESISRELLKYGIEKNGKKCDEKWRNLKKMYDKIVNDQKKTGAGKIFWKYFEDFKEIYFSDPQFNPIVTASSTGVLKRRNENIEVSDLYSSESETSMSTETTPKKSLKLSPGEEPRKKILSSYEIEQRRQKRHEEKIALKKEMFSWFKNKFGPKPDENNENDN